MSETPRRHAVHVETIPVRWGDMDALGHVNNTNFFRFMEQARVGWLAGLGRDLSRGHAEGPVLVNAACTFLKPIVYPETLEVTVELSSPGRSSFVIHHRIHRKGDPSVLYGEGQAKTVWVDYAAGRSVALPENLRALMEGS